MQAIVGVLLFVALAYLLSENRRGVAWRAVAFGIGLQFVLAVVLLKIPVVSQVLFGLNQFVVAIEAATTAGTVFLFGYLRGRGVALQYFCCRRTLSFCFSSLASGDCVQRNCGAAMALAHIAAFCPRTRMAAAQNHAGRWRSGYGGCGKFVFGDGGSAIGYQSLPCAIVPE